MDYRSPGNKIIKMKTQLLPLILLIPASILFFNACKKNSKGPDENSQRIKSISDGSQATILEYDGQGRVIRVYYNASSSLKFTYSPAGVNVQRLGSGDVPDPDRNTDFSIVNGRITNGTEFLPDKRTRKFYYGYDDQGRLIQVYVQLQYDGTTDETHIYILTYDTQNNVAAINFVRKDNGGIDNSDSVYIAKTWYDKKFVTWNNLGFGFFGSAAFGQQHLGYGITVPFNIATHIFPADNALKSETEDNYVWNPVTKKWIFQSTNSFARPETDYGYDGSGRLINYSGRTIEWQ
jgi:YD repeat-containing protein